MEVLFNVSLSSQLVIEECEVLDINGAVLDHIHTEECSNLACLVVGAVGKVDDGGMPFAVRSPSAYVGRNESACQLGGIHGYEEAVKAGSGGAVLDNHVSGNDQTCEGRTCVGVLIFAGSGVGNEAALVVVLGGHVFHRTGSHDLTVIEVIGSQGCGVVGNSGSCYVGKGSIEAVLTGRICIQCSQTGVENRSVAGDVEILGSGSSLTVLQESALVIEGVLVSAYGVGADGPRTALDVTDIFTPRGEAGTASVKGINLLGVTLAYLDQQGNAISTLIKISDRDINGVSLRVCTAAGILNVVHGSLEGACANPLGFTVVQDVTVISNSETAVTGPSAEANRLTCAVDIVDVTAGDLFLVLDTCITEQSSACVAVDVCITIVSDGIARNVSGEGLVCGCGSSADNKVVAGRSYGSSVSSSVSLCAVNILSTIDGDGSILGINVGQGVFVSITENLTVIVGIENQTGVLTCSIDHVLACAESVLSAVSVNVNALSAVLSGQSNKLNSRVVSAADLNDANVALVVLALNGLGHLLSSKLSVSACLGCEELDVCEVENATGSVFTNVQTDVLDACGTLGRPSRNIDNHNLPLAIANHGNGRIVCTPTLEKFAGRVLHISIHIQGRCIGMSVVFQRSVLDDCILDVSSRHIFGKDNVGIVYANLRTIKGNVAAISFLHDFHLAASNHSRISAYSPEFGGNVLVVLAEVVFELYGVIGFSGSLGSSLLAFTGIGSGFLAAFNDIVAFSCENAHGQCREASEDHQHSHDKCKNFFHVFFSFS